MKRFSAKDFKEMPWKNGGGITTELFRIPDGDGGFLLRISRARVEKDGPFSFFPDVDRKLLILEGEGCRLIFPDKEEVLQKGRVLEFKGEDSIDCKLLKGPFVDFNIMIARKYGEAKATISSSDFQNAQYIYHPRTETLFQFENEEVRVDFPGEEHIIIKIQEK